MNRGEDLSLPSDVKRIGVIGHFGIGLDLFDGQTVKTRTLADGLESFYKIDAVRVDTHGWSRHPIELLVSLIHCLDACSVVFVLLSNKGRRYLFPLLSWLARVKRVRVLHCLIGGNLTEEVRKYPREARALKSFEMNWVESHALVQELKDLGIPNVEFFPNFKELKPVSLDERTYSSAPPYRLCMFSRVMEEKGILDGIRAVKSINKKLGFVFCTLDIYGPVEKSFSEIFLSELDSCCESSYKGCVDYSKSVDVLSKYDVLLFPTYWPSEGMPGTIIDAFAAGLPVIASHWNCYDELLEDGVTGFSYEYGRQDQLPDAIFKVLNRPETIQNFGRLCRQRFERYSLENAMRRIGKTLTDGASSHG